VGGGVASGGRSNAPFVGRDRELALIAAAADDAALSRPWVVWVEGEAGSGKTTLVREAVRRLPEGYQVSWNQAIEPAADVTMELAARMAETDAGSPFAMGMELLGTWSRRQDAGPAAVVVEDLHWADPASRLALLAAVSRLESDRLLFVVTSRPGHAADGSDRIALDGERCVALRVGELDVDQVAELAHAVGVSLTQIESERLHRHTAGLALYVRTLLAELTPAQLKTEGRELPAPRSLASAVIATLAELPPAARDLAAAMAVANQPLALTAVGRIAGVDAPIEPFESLLASGLVRWDRDLPGTPVEFTHPLHRSAVDQDLSPTRRRDLHRAAATVLPAADSLPHRFAAADGADEELADELEASARTAIIHDAPGMAARDLLWASSLSDDAASSENRLLNAIRALLADGQAARAHDFRSRAESSAPSALRSLVLGLLEWDRLDASAAEGLLREATVGDATGPNGPLAARAWAELAEIALAQGRAGETTEAARRALALALPGTAAERLGWSFVALGEAMTHGAQAGLAELRPYLPVAATDVPTGLVDVLVIRATLELYAGRTMAALADSTAVLELARRGSTPVQIARSHFQLGTLFLVVGDWDAALLNARVGESIVGDGPVTTMQAQCHALLATVLALRGQTEAAADHLSAAEAAAAVQREPEAVITARIAAAALARVSGHSAQVIELLEDLPDVVPMLAALAFWPVLVNALIDAGRLDDASAEIERLEVAAAARGLTLAARLSGLRGRLAAARGRPAEAIEWYEAALAGWEADDPYLERAQLHHGFGRLLRAVGERRAGVEQLRVAHELLASVGAGPDLAAVEADLVAAGFRGSPHGSGSALELTDRERDVAVLVAKGLTNPEAAAELYISRKAVEYHLGNIYGKLGIRSRRELSSVQL
jgi:DNA-binding CsgD family transcriptional regulator